MINANELRIGNWVQINDRIVKVEYVFFMQSKWQIEWSCGPHIGTNDLYYSNVSGIPLKPDILVACGFKRDTAHGTFWLNGVRINDDGKPFYLINTLKTKIIGIEIKYLHQLQNLYFSLTEKELEYNPK